MSSLSRDEFAVTRIWRRWFFPLSLFLGLFLAGDFAQGAFNLGGGENYALLFEGHGGNTLQVTNVTVNGNVGVATTGKMTDSGPSTINGAVNFSAANGGQFSNNNGSNVITGGVSYSVSSVTSSMNWLNNLSQTLYGDHGTNVAINGTMTLNASSGTPFVVNGQTVNVFDATSFLNSGGQTLTINGSATDLVAVNLDGLGNIQFHGQIVLTGGIGGDNVLWNIGGGDYVNQTGAASLDVNNNGGKVGSAQGIFLDPNGAISITNAVILGRVFGGDSHDFQYVSGALIDTPPPPPVPDTGGTIALLAISFAGIEGWRKLRRKREA